MNVTREQQLPPPSPAVHTHARAGMYARTKASARAHPHTHTLQPCMQTAVSPSDRLEASAAYSESLSGHFAMTDVSASRRKSFSASAPAFVGIEIIVKFSTTEVPQTYSKAVGQAEDRAVRHRALTPLLRASQALCFTWVNTKETRDHFMFTHLDR